MFSRQLIRGLALGFFVLLTYSSANILVSSDCSSIAAGLSEEANETSSSFASVLLAVSPSQVYPLASVSEKETISMILHSRLRDGDDAQQSIRPNVIHLNIEMLNGLERKTFRFTTAELSTQ